MLKKSNHADLLEASALANVNIIHQYGRTALHLACAEGHCDAVKKLLSRKAITDDRDIWGHEPPQETMLAATQTQSEFLKWLA